MFITSIPRNVGVIREYSEFVLRKLYLTLLNASSSVVNLGEAQIPVWSGGRWIPAIYPLGTDSPSATLAQLRGDT